MNTGINEWWLGHLQSNSDVDTELSDLALVNSHGLQVLRFSVHG